MNLICAFLTIVAIGLGLAVLLPVLGVGLALATVAGGLFIWVLPILLIAASDRTTAGEKFAWILAIVFLSWFAWIFYLLLAPIRQPVRHDYRYQYERYRRGPDRYDRYRYD
jgi:hypothetical protein